jgi:glycosyltransferase involved in cell wall biosynthesis
MRIAQVAPLNESLPTKLYGGTERVVSYLTEELVRLGNARALLFPIDWPELFGLVMIEAMACGTPVIAWRNGAAPEVVTDGVTGFVVESIEEAAHAVGRVSSPSRRAFRQEFEEGFDAARMARDYVEVYRLLASACPRHARP